MLRTFVAAAALLAFPVIVSAADEPKDEPKIKNQGQCVSTFNQARKEGKVEFQNNQEFNAARKEGCEQFKPD